MENTYFVTITGIDHYYGKKPFEIGRVVKLVKDSENAYDSEAIVALLPIIDTIGYVANSTNTVYKGTISAGRLYDKFEDYAYARIMFVTHTSAIALVIDKDTFEKDEPDEDEEKPAVAVSTETDKPKKSKKNPIGFIG